MGLGQLARISNSNLLKILPTESKDELPEENRKFQPNSGYKLLPFLKVYSGVFGDFNAPVVHVLPKYLLQKCSGTRTATVARRKPNVSENRLRSKKKTRKPKKQKTGEPVKLLHRFPGDRKDSRTGS